MPQLKGKTILLISPQSWGSMFLSKHHYALELAKRGNKVYFLCPKDESLKMKGNTVSVNQSPFHENLFFIEHKLFFPYQIKFHSISLFHWLMKIHTKRVLKKIKEPIDIVWSFDLGNYFPFSFFGSQAYKIFHPVDEPLTKESIVSAKCANIIFSVTQEILDKYKKFNIAKYFINHGVADEFLLAVETSQQHAGKIRIGFSGNLTRSDIDREVLLQIINENPGMIFDFWGGYNFKQSNIGGAQDKATEAFIATLQQLNNVELHGAVAPVQLAKAIRTMDAFLICYDILKDQSKGTNYHKVMEFISTGKVIISNNITTYKNNPELVQMTGERTHNKALPQLFKKITADLSYYNAPSLQQQRFAFAADNSYKKQIEKIERLTSAL